MHTFLSPAKLNLGLKIIGKRPDGYHLLQTIFCRINLYDKIEIRINHHDSSISLLDHHYPWPPEHDLAYKAAKLLQAHTKCNLGARIKIEKNIPHGGGMGGGSSNAATILKELNHLWQLNLSQTELMNLGLELGADVPFFIFDQNAYAEGIGEILTPIKLAQLYFVVVIPEFSLATRDVFKNLKKTSPLKVSCDYLCETLHNDLTECAINLEPRLAQIFNDLSQYGTPAMTGSGSTIFLRFSEQTHAKKVADSLKTKYNSFLVKSC